MVTFYGGVKRKSVSVAGDNILEWTLDGKEHLIGYIGANMTTNPCNIALHLANEPNDMDLRQVHFKCSRDDKGVAHVFPKKLTARYVEIWFEDCVVGDVLKGALIFDR